MYKKPINLLTLDKKMCCNLLNKKDFCLCPDNFNLQEESLKTVISMLTKSLETLDKDGFKLINNVRCNVSTYDEQTKSRFEEILEDKLVQNPLYKNSSVLQVKVEGTIKIGTNESYEVVAKYINDVIELQQDKTVSPVRPFYRIGITHVSISSSRGR